MGTEKQFRKCHLDRQVASSRLVHEAQSRLR